ncbi:MAG: cell envelope integrity protein TolA [Polaromonas sp.]|nr:cell envelope integrity protein TolA [Polaromonas sp.]
MPSAADRLEFAPHRDPGALRAFGLAVLVHLLLIAALTWGVNWKRSNPDISFEAELWSSLPQEAAPKPVETPPPPPPAAEPQVKAPPPPTPNVDIALEQEKKRKLEQQKKKAEDKALKAKALELAKRKAAEDARKLEARKLEADKQEAQKLADQRKKNLDRMLGQAGATGAANAKGTAQKSSGPSASYGGKVRAKVKPNIVFTDDIAGNPTAEVEVRTSLDGSIISQRLIKSSGNKAWDEAVIKAILRTETMPRDVDGRVPSPMILEFRPKD